MNTYQTTNQSMTLRLITIAILALAAEAAFAQGAMLPPTGPAGPQTPDTKEGPAEQETTTEVEVETTRVRPTLGSRYELFEINGLFRFRTDWFKNLNLGFNDDPTLGGAPFRQPLSCNPTSGVNKPCGNTIKTANMRLRLEPVINITENARVYFQIDALDNVVLGSTPDGRFLDGTPAPTNIPITAFAGSQVPPIAGRNSLRDSIVVKRAWGEVVTPIGAVRFGRMPSHWGLGILANGGAARDEIHGTVDRDNDYGDTADRLLYGLKIPTTEIKAAVAMDWASTTPVADQTDIFANRYDGQPWDLEDADDVNQWVFLVLRNDAPETFKRRVKNGEWVFNYGAYFVWRTQGWDHNPPNTVGSAPSPASFNPRNATAYIPDVWMRLAKGTWEVEMEAVSVLGSIDRLDDLGITESLDVRQFGAVVKGHKTFLNESIKVGLEWGYASGDQWDNVPAGSTNVRDARALPGPGDTTVSNFIFDLGYTVDLILYRELLGAVRNATYAKPTFSYKVRDFTLSTAGIFSFAPKPVATPGNASFYGFELDIDVGYESNGFFAGIAYGVFFPGAAMDHPEDLPGQGGPGFGFGTNSGDAGTAHTIQTRLMLEF